MKRENHSEEFMKLKVKETNLTNLDLSNLNRTELAGLYLIAQIKEKEFCNLIGIEYSEDVSDSLEEFLADIRDAVDLVIEKSTARG